MSVRRLALLGPVLALGLLAPFAHADFTPSTPKTEVFLKCAGDTKEQTVNELNGGPAVAWGKGAPASVTTGAGCGKADDGFFGGADFQTAFQLAFDGAHTGNVDAVTVDLYSASVGDGRPTLEPVELEVRMTVDGISMFGSDTGVGATGQTFTIPRGRVIPVTPVATGATGGVTKYSFTVTGLDLLLEKDTGEHQFAFDIASGPLVSEAWLWGAAEAPSGAVLNPTTPAAAKAQADKRVVREKDLELDEE